LSSEREARDHRLVAGGDHRPRLVTVVRPDVDVQVLQLYGLLALLGVREVRRLASHHAGHDPVAGEDLDPLPHEHLRVPAAGLHDMQEALVAHVAHEQRDLVDVTDHRHQRVVAGAVHAGDGRAEPVGGNVVREALRRLAPHARGNALVPGRAGGGEQLLKQVGRGHGARG
jgi:hypothetical protein